MCPEESGAAGEGQHSREMLICKMEPGLVHLAGFLPTETEKGTDTQEDRQKARARKRERQREADRLRQTDREREGGGGEQESNSAAVRVWWDSYSPVWLKNPPVCEYCGILKFSEI